MTRALTERQLTVLCWLAGGATGKEIADELGDGVSMSAVNNSIFEARHKLGAKNSVHLVAIAYQRGILAKDLPVVAPDLIAQAIGDPGSIVGRKLGPSWGVGNDGYAETEETVTRWATRAVLALLNPSDAPAAQEETGPPRCRTDSVVPHEPATWLIDDEPRCDFCAALIGGRGMTRTPLINPTDGAA